MEFDFLYKTNEIENIKNAKVVICNFFNIKIDIDSLLNENYIKELQEKSKTQSSLIFCFVNTITDKGAVVIISDGFILDIYEEGEIYSSHNLKYFDTRIGKVAILVNSDILDDSLFYALKAFNIDLCIVFSNGTYKDIFSFNDYTVPQIILQDEKIF